MKLFGKNVAEYVSFAKPVLTVIFIVWALRFGLSLAGFPNSTTKWSSTTVVALLGMVYFAVRVHTQGFGSYKQLFGLLLTQNVFANALVIVGILWAMVGGHDNVFSAQEYSGGMGANWLHAGLHVLIGMLGFSLVMWAVGSLILLVTKSLASHKGGAATAPTA